MTTKLILIFLAAGLGGILRYLISGGIQNLPANTLAPFPAGTLFVNVLGCLLIGFLGTVFLGGEVSVKIPEVYRIAILVGLLGGFTTFSTFSYETLRLLEDQEYKLAVLTVIFSNVGGLLAAFLGWRAAVKIFAS